MLNVEVQPLFRHPGGLGQGHHHVLVGLVGDHQFDGIQQGTGGLSVGVWLRDELADHLRQVAPRQGLHLGPVHGNVVVEFRVRPDDGVHLRPGAAGVGLHHFDIGRGAGGSRAHHHGGRAIPEEHARGADGPDLVGELLRAHHQDGPLDLLQQAHRLGEAVGHPRTGGHDVAGSVGLHQSQLPGKPAGDRGNDAGAGATAKQDRTDFRGPALGLGQRRPGRQQRHFLQPQLGVAAPLDAGLLEDLGFASCATSSRRDCGSGRHWCRGSRLRKLAMASRRGMILKCWRTLIGG